MAATASGNAAGTIHELSVICELRRCYRRFHPGNAGISSIRRFCDAVLDTERIDHSFKGANERNVHGRFLSWEVTCHMDRNAIVDRLRNEDAFSEPAEELFQQLFVGGLDEAFIDSDVTVAMVADLLEHYHLCA